jgi:calcium-dependent protein kinase
MGCVVRKNKTTVTSLNKFKPKDNSTKYTFKIDCSTFIREQEGNPYEEYDVIEFLGEGSFGKVYKVKNKESTKEFAMKVISKSAAFSPGSDEREILKEINILKSLDHQNIMKIYEYYNTPLELYIISELCRYGELLTKLAGSGYISEDTTWKIMKQIFSAVAYCHSNNIIHRDLKPQNIMIMDENEESFAIKVIDFGTSEIFHTPLCTGCIGTVYYIAPEIVRMDEYDSKCDLWSCGVMMYLYLAGDLPFPGNTEKEVYKKILNGSFDFTKAIWRTISQEAKDLINKLLVKDPKERISAQQALDHPWIKNKLKMISRKSINSVYRDFSKFKVTQLLQHAALLYMVRHTVRGEEFLDVRRKFSLLDANKDGKLSYEEFVTCLCEIMDKPEAERSVTEFFKLTDTDKNGFIEFEEFLKVCLHKNTLLSEDNMLNTFNLFDLNKDGKICANDLKRILGNNKDDVHDSYWEELISQYDTNDDGMLTFIEFKNMMNQVKGS